MRNFLRGVAPSLYVLLASFGSAAAPQLHGAPILINGSFEDPAATNVGVFLRLNATSTAMTGWTVSAASIDWIGTLWQHSSGNRSLDMAGLSTGGTVRQDVSGFDAGNNYELVFDLAGNPFINTTKTLRVNVLNGATVVGTNLFNFTQGPGTSLTNMGWVTQTLSFVAPVSGALRLEFIGLNNDGSGPALDNVRLNDLGPSTNTAVPEPATFALAGAGIGLVLLRRRSA